MFVIFPKMRAISRGVSKPSIAALCNKKKLIGRDEYSRLMVYFFYPRKIFDPVMAGQMLNSGDLPIKIEVT